MDQPSVDKATADKILLQALRQLQTSRTYKRARMDQIRENENLYHGITDKNIRNPFSECFPMMAGYVDHLKSKIDDDSSLLFDHQAEADYKRAIKINAFYDKESSDPSPNASWSLKHRYAKTNAIFSGVAIYEYYAESDPDYRSCLSVVSHYDFHCEPRGGGILENHLFCGRDNIFKNFEEMTGASHYDQTQVKHLIDKYKTNDYKDNNDYDAIRNNRFDALKQDPVTNNYVGQNTIKLVQWYTTFQGKRYYILFNENASVWVRCCPMTDLFPDNLYPYPVWHTNEDPDVFWSKAPADDARPVAKIINTMINQELYNRQKRNYGQRGYDAEMFPNVQALADWRPDGLVPVDTKGGTRLIGNGVYEFKVGDLNGTLDLVSWLDNFTGSQTGNTPGSRGQTETDKKVGVFRGELEQVERLIGVKNKSYRDALSRLGLLFKQGLDHNLTTATAVRIMGAEGVEWSELTPEDLKTEQPLNIVPKGGTSEQSLRRAQDAERSVALESPIMQAVNPQWRARQSLLLKGWSEQDVKDAFSPDSFATKELLSEAAQAEKDIIENKKPKLNRGATVAFMQHIIDFAYSAEDLPLLKFKELIAYAEAHAELAIENETRNIKDMLRARRANALGSTSPSQDQISTKSPVIPSPSPAPAAGY